MVVFRLHRTYILTHVSKKIEAENIKRYDENTQEIFRS